MSNKTITEDIQGTLFWVKVKDIDPGYNPTKLPVEQLDKKDASWNVTLVVSEDDYDEFVAKYPKKASQPVLNANFLEKFKVDTVPFPDQKKQYILKFKQKAYNKKGEPSTFRPTMKTFDENNNLTDITDVKVANGSKGRVRYTAFSTPNLPEPIISLSVVCVDHLIPYDDSKKDPTSFNPL